MGPRSTAPFLEAVIDVCQFRYGARHDEDFPAMMIYSLPTPFYLDRPLDHARMEEVIIEGLRTLEAASVKCIAMPCNSAHVYFDRLKAAIDVPLLNIVDETMQRMPETPGKITLLATPTTIESGIYQAGLQSAGYTFVLKEDWQQHVNQLIASIKSGEPKEQLEQQWSELVDKLRQAHITTIMLACTDLQVVTGEKMNGVHIVDSAICLAEAVAQEFYECVRA